MGLTDKGRWTSSVLDERGKRVVGNLTEQGQMVYGLAPAYVDGVITLGLVQNIYKDDVVNLPLVQSIYKDGSINLALTQNIYKDGTLNLALVQSIYKDSSINLTLTQSIYKDGTLNLSLTQSIYKDGTLNLPLVQNIYKDGTLNLSLVQSIYKDGTVDLPLEVNIVVEKISVINLNGEHIINIPFTGEIRPDVMLEGSYILTISLDGEVRKDISLEGSHEVDIPLRGDTKMTLDNRNFTMYSGNSKNLKITVSGDPIAGGTVTWIMKANRESDVAVLTKTSPTITIVGNVITVPLVPADTNSLLGSYFYTCRVVDANGFTSTVCTGNIDILND